MKDVFERLSGESQRASGSISIISERPEVSESVQKPALYESQAGTSRRDLSDQIWWGESFLALMGDHDFS